MDEFRIFIELLNRAIDNENFQRELRSLLEVPIINESNILQLRIVLELCERFNFNIGMHRINAPMEEDEFFNTTSDVRTFIRDNNIDEEQNFSDFVREYTNVGFNIRFSVDPHELTLGLRVPRMFIIGAWI